MAEITIDKETFAEYFHQGLGEILTDRGNHYFKTLRKQYMMGLPIKDEKLMVLSVLLIHSEKFTLKDFKEGEVLVSEIHNNVGEFDSFHIVEELAKYGYMKTNPNYDREKGQLMGEAIHEALGK